MAYKDSDELKIDERYPLGDYSFRLERTSVPGSSNDKIEAICTKDGKNARKSIQVPSLSQMNGWYVEANETEATVYAMVSEPKKGEGGGGTVVVPGTVIGQDPTGPVISRSGGGEPPIYLTGVTMCSISGFSISFYIPNGAAGVISAGPVTYKGERFYIATYNAEPDLEAAYNCLYGPWEYGDPVPMMVGRFAIDLEDAGGVGPGSDWTDPGDYDPDWEPDDPTHTLYVEVTGALSGRHNDPIVDPSYSYLPADKDTVKGYGCGGDGGHGGGGGAGASTVVIHKFATNQANSKEVTALARRHGYGSGGGKGGKGGDGCILVYY